MLPENSLRIVLFEIRVIIWNRFAVRGSQFAVELGFAARTSYSSVQPVIRLRLTLYLQNDSLNLCLQKENIVLFLKVKAFPTVYISTTP